MSMGTLGLANSRPSLAARRRVEKRRSAYLCSIELSGQLAVCLVILVAFMVAPQPYQETSVDLARSWHCGPLRNAVRDDALTVVVTRDGKIYLGTGQVAPEALPSEIEGGIKSGSENRVYLSADARARYSDVKLALDAIRLAGVEDVSFLTRSASRQ